LTLACHTLWQVADAVGKNILSLRDRILADHAELGVALEAGSRSGSPRRAVWPTSGSHNSRVEHVGGPGLDRHDLGGSDVIDVGWRDSGIDRANGVGS